ncbi:hypothetical protein T484DRAFT_1614700 [Baffinella frigidus]|nr:hypothetical protein T484DRAFT_1614700 [Cryptophyta sp. CCMP2293]
MYCQTISVSAAHATHRATYCTPCRPLTRAFSGWIPTPPPTNLSTPTPPPQTRNGHAEVVGALLSGDHANVGKADKHGRTALYYAAWKGHLAVVEELLEEWDADPNQAVRQVPYTLHLTPYTMHPTPCTLHPRPCTLHPTPYTLHHAPYTLHPTPYTLHLTPHTLHPTPYTLHPTPHTPHPTPCTLHPTPHTLQPTPYTLHATP